MAGELRLASTLPRVGNAVYCSFKLTPNDRENVPIRAFFRLTRTHWKFAGLGNINE